MGVKFQFGKLSWKSLMVVHNSDTHSNSRTLRPKSDWWLKLQPGFHLGVDFLGRGTRKIQTATVFL